MILEKKHAGTLTQRWRWTIWISSIWLFHLGTGKLMAMETRRFELSMPMMGTKMDLVLYAQSQEQAQLATDACLEEIQRLSRIVSNYDAGSEISLLCKNAFDAPVAISPELREILHEAYKWHRVSLGKFDVTIGPLTQRWRIARKQKVLPMASEVADAVARTGWDQVVFLEAKEEFDRMRVRLNVPEMYLDLSGLATGFIMDRAAQKIKDRGIRSFMINIGGDICLGEAPTGQLGWRIDVGGLGPSDRSLIRLNASNCSITSSGDLHQFIEIDGRRYSHLIDPLTHAPIERRQSVTVIARTTLDADAGATALAILSPESACQIFSSMPLTEAYYLEAFSEDDFVPHLRFLHQ